jgi:hypothetical protein
MLMVNHYARMYMPSSNTSLVITVTLKDNENCPMIATVLLYILQKHYIHSS